MDTISIAQTDMTTSSNNHLYKLLVVGDYAVGKTSLIRRYCTGEFTSNYRITIGVDFCLKHLDWDDSTSVSLQLWDIAGHERFGAMTRVYYKFAIAAVVCFDISRPSTLDNVKKWRDDISDKVVLPDGSPIPMLLLANKCDLPDITIDKAKMNRFATQNGFLAWFETSAKNNTNIDTAFQTLVSHILKLSKSMKIAPPDTSTGGGLNVIGAPMPRKAASYNRSDRNSRRGRGEDEDESHRQQQQQQQQQQYSSSQTDEQDETSSSQRRFYACCT